MLLELLRGVFPGCIQAGSERWFTKWLVDDEGSVGFVGGEALKVVCDGSPWIAQGGTSIPDPWETWFQGGSWIFRGGIGKVEAGKREWKGDIVRLKKRDESKEDHHIYCHKGRYYIDLVFVDAVTSVRRRFTLQTGDVEVARRRRDKILRELEGREVEV